MLRNAKVAASLSPAPATEKTSRSSVWRVNLGSWARFRPALCYVRREVETAREATCPKVRDMENEVRRARRTSAPFGWKASACRRCPRASFFASSEPRVCLLRRAAAESRQNASECKCVPRGRAAPSGDISLCTRHLVCGGQGAERRGRKLCYRRPNDETAPGGPSGTVNASGRRSCPPETSRT